MSITRRLFLRNTAAAGAVGATIAAPVVAEAATPMTLHEQADYHARELVKLMDVLHPHKKYRYRLDHEYGYAFICGDLKSA